MNLQITILLMGLILNVVAGGAEANGIGQGNMKLVGGAEANKAGNKTNGGHEV